MRCKLWIMIGFVISLHRKPIFIATARQLIVPYEVDTLIGLLESDKF